MSIANLNKKYKPEDVIPYIQNLYYNVLPKFSKPFKIYLVGSRGKIAFDRWNELEGKDWDLLIVFNHSIRNPKKIINQDYNVDIMRCDTEEIIDKIRKNTYNGSSKGFEIFPNTPDFLKQYLK